MDEWEVFIEGYHESDDPLEFTKVLKTADNIIAQDLASFEMDWFLSTLIEKPINLLEVVSERYKAVDWNDCTLKSLKLLTGIVVKYDNVCKYYDKIVALCQLPYAPKIKQEALSCLIGIVPRSEIPATHLNQYLTALMVGDACKSPLALIIGAICEHHPNVVEEMGLVTNIWRVFLNLLENNKNTPKCIKSILEGIMGLLKHFGMELTTLELNNFFDTFVKYIHLPGCENTVLSLLSAHSALVRERVASSHQLRAAVWHPPHSLLAREALKALYSAVAKVVSDDDLQNIIKTEIEPHIRSHLYLQKFTALYILSDIYKSRGIGDLNEYVNTQELEFDIRKGNVDYETCEAISWCVQSNVLYSDRLLHAAILFYDKFVALKRQDVIVNTLLQAEKLVRSAAVLFLILESSRSFEQYKQLWHDLLDNNENTTVLEHASLVVDDAVEYMVGMVEAFGDEEPPPHVKAQLSVIQRVLRSHQRTQDVACVASTLCGTENESSETVLDDDDKLQQALALIEADSAYTESEMISALEIIFSKKQVKASVLSKGLIKLEDLIQSLGLGDDRVNKIIREVEKRSKRIDRRKKEERELYKDIITFLGKYGGYYSNNVDEDSVLIARLKNKLSLELPYQNTTLKLNLKELCHAAIECEDAEACHTLCDIICATLAIKKDEVLQSVLIRLLVCLSHCDVDVSYIMSAVSMCDAVCANELIEWIKREKSIRSMRVLLEALEVLLQSDSEGLLLQSVIENIILCDCETKQTAVAEIIEKLLKLLKDSTLLCQKYLPKMLIKVLKLQNSNLIKIVTDIFIDKIQLYDGDSLTETTDNIFRVLSVKNKMADVTIKMAIEFVIKIIEMKKLEIFLLEYYINTSKEINLSVLVRIKRENKLSSEDLQVFNDWLSKQFFCCDNFDVDGAIFDFIAEYADILVDFDKENTYKVISHIISKLKPETIIINQRKLSKCVSSLRNTKNYESVLIKTNFEDILRYYPIRSITDNIEKYTFEIGDEMIVSSLNVVMKLFDDGPILMEYADCIRKWLRWMVKLNTSGFIERSEKSKMEFFNDLVTVSMRFYSFEEFFDLVYEEDKISGVNFLRTFMSATFKYLTEEPYRLLLAERQCCLLLIDVVKYAVRRNRRSEVLKMVHNLWPIFSEVASFDQKYWLVRDLVTSELPPESPLSKWVDSAISKGTLVEKIKLVALITSGTDVMAVLGSLIPPRDELDCVTSCVLRAILDVLAFAPGVPLWLRINFITLESDGTVTHGWWDDAIDMALATLAHRADLKMLQWISGRPHPVSGVGVNDQLVLTFLRHTKLSLFEEFISIILNDLLSMLKKAPRSLDNSYSYYKCLKNYISSLDYIQLIFEKVPKEDIESPNSVLYSKMSDPVRDTPFYLVSMVCKYCYTLRSKVECPEIAGTLLDNYRSFYWKNYNCMTTAILLRDPKPLVYGTVFDVQCWDKLIGDEDIQLPIREKWRQRSRRPPAPAALPALLSRSRSDVRTRMFTRTLSENPLAYDLVQEDELPQPLEMELADNPLNRHPCSTVLCALLAVQGARGPEIWLSALEKGLKEGRTPVRWLLAQAVVNSREELRPHAGALVPALLAVLRDTRVEGKYNGLHVDILDTIILWGEKTCDDISSVVECLISTAVDNRHRSNVYRSLVDKMAHLLELWKDVRLGWTCFERYFADPKSDAAKVCVQLLKQITKCKIVIPELLNSLLEALETRKDNKFEIYELLGLVLAIDDRRENYMKRYLKILDRLKKTDKAEYIKMLYYVQKGYPKGCDENNFKSIIDLTRKMTAREKSKCLEILSTHIQTDGTRDVLSIFDTVGLGESLNTIEGLKLLRNGLHLLEEHSRKYYTLQVAQLCRLLPEKLKVLAYDILIKSFDISSTSEASAPPAKRVAKESNSLILAETDDFTRILLEEIARAVVEDVPGVKEGVGSVLSKELDVRFIESYQLVMKQTDRAVNPAAVLDIFFHVIRDERLKSARLREEIMDVSGQVSSMALKDSVKEALVGSTKKDELKKDGNTQTTLDSALVSLLKFCERNSNAAVSLLVQLVKVFPAKRPGFDFSSSLGATVTRTLAASYWPVAVARAGLVGWGGPDSTLIGLKEAIENLSQVTKNSQDEIVCKLLEEDYRLRCLGPEQFNLGSFNNYYVPSDNSKSFTVESLLSAFGTLSNWDNLTFQEKTSIKNDLPPLWANSDHFTLPLEQYDIEDVPVWVRCMLSPRGPGYVKYLRDVDRWPRRLFDISAVTETPILHNMYEENIPEACLRSKILPSECLAEWAARMLIRSIYIHSSHLSRSDALSWCTSASERALHSQVLLCCKAYINDEGLCESEVLKWFRLRVLALRAIALDDGNSDGLRSALNLALTFTPRFIGHSSLGDTLGMNEVVLKIRRDLKSLDKNHVESVIQGIVYRRDDVTNMKDKNILQSICTLALTFYNELWDTAGGVAEQNDLVLEMITILSLIVQLDLGPKHLSSDVIINRIVVFTGDEFHDQVAVYLLNILQPIIKDLDTISLDIIRSRLDLFKGWEDHEVVKYLRRDESMQKYKMCLHLVGDAGHLLMQYCSKALKVIQDKAEWTVIFKELKRNIFENPYAGTDYKVLEKYKEELNCIEDYDSTDNETKKRVLSKILSQPIETRSSVSLSHVCPTLCEKEIADDSLNKLLCLKSGISVFKFEEKVPIFVDSIRRPAVLCVRLSDGTSRRYIVKRGERTRTHCAAVRLLTTVQPGATAYNVTQLSEDSALIEYLEHHERFRSMILEKQPFDATIDTMTRARSTDGNLILSPDASLRHFEALCQRVPAYLLRSAIEDHSACVQDFINKKNNFLEAVASMTMFSYLCGLGDRHLENIMYSLQDGRALPVDLDAIFQYGANELPPARLTRNILAVLDTQILESRLQIKTLSLRESSNIVLPSISLTLKWMGGMYIEKLPYITSLIEGTSLSHLVTIDVISKSAQQYKEKYVQLLKDLFKDFDDNNKYTVEEQVTSLLRQSTEPRILSVTRSGWEPWI